MKSSRRSLAPVEVALARAWLAAAALLVVVFAVALGACGSSARPAADPSSLAETMGASRLVAPAGWGVQFEVSGWLSRGGELYERGSLGLVLFSSDESQNSGGILIIARHQSFDEFTIAKTIRLLGEPEPVLSLLPGGVGSGADLTVVREAAEMRVGPGWRGVGARYVVRLAPGKERPFGQDVFGYEVVMFRHAGSVYQIVMTVAPADQFDARQAELELTMQTIAARGE